MQNLYTLKLTKQQEEQLYTTWSECKAPTPPYAKWQLRPENCVITCYESGKTVFQGKDASVYASPFTSIVAPVIKDKNIFPQAGSDEVGTGDYFGPVVVAATIITKENASLLLELGVRDSKKLTDKDILEIAPKLIQKIPHTILILTPEKYNQVHETNNMNAIKAKLHNQAYVNLQNKYGLPSFKIIDQFTPERNFYRYISQEKKVIRGITFQTKAEDDFLSVGCASVIARYAFLKKMKEMEKEWSFDFPKGASSKVDAYGQKFVDAFGFEALSKVAKVHFKNTEKLH